jgi:hypothetical protein
MHAGKSFWSMKIGREYRIQLVEDDRIVIQRLRGQPTVLTRSAVARAVDLLNQANGGVGRRTLLPKVAREAVFVSLHPRLRWSDDLNRIEVVDSSGAPVIYKDFGQAPNDDPTELQEFARRVRAGQRRFRENLLNLYGARCAITDWGPSEVLECAHILWHSDSGLNDTGNGLLLRSDLHTLFDAGLLRIHPSRLVVVLDEVLEGTPYWELNGAPLRPRVDGSQPRLEYLEARWSSSRGAG